jgi:Rod binding domain-containing protein
MQVEVQRLVEKVRAPVSCNSTAAIALTKDEFTTLVVPMMLKQVRSLEILNIICYSMNL